MVRVFAMNLRLKPVGFLVVLSMTLLQHESPFYLPALDAWFGCSLWGYEGGHSAGVWSWWGHWACRVGRPPGHTQRRADCYWPTASTHHSDSLINIKRPVKFVFLSRIKANSFPQLLRGKCIIIATGWFYSMLAECFVGKGLYKVLAFLKTERLANEGWE